MTPARAAALAILLAIAGALWIGPIGTYRDFVAATSDRVAAAEAKLAQFRAIALAPVETSPGATTQAVFLPQATDAEAIALLQETLKAAAATAQVEIQGIQILSSETLQGASRLGVRLQGRGDMAGVQRLLYAIDAARPILFPDNLQLLTQAQPHGTLVFQLDVFGFRGGPPA